MEALSLFSKGCCFWKGALDLPLVCLGASMWSPGVLKTCCQRLMVTLVLAQKIKVRLLM